MQVVYENECPGNSDEHSARFTKSDLVVVIYVLLEFNNDCG